MRTVGGRHRRARGRRQWTGPAAWVAVAGLTVGSLLLALHGLGAHSLWLDEGYTWLTAARKTGDIVALARFQGYHLLPYYLLVHGFIRLFGDGPVAMRMPSALAGAVAVPLMYLLVRRLAGVRAGLFATVLFVVSQPLVFWQQNARDYAFVVLLAVASVLAAVVGIQTGRIRALLVWAGLAALGCYTHPEMLLMQPLVLAVMLIWARTWRLRAALGAIVAVGALASLPSLFNAAHSNVYQTTTLLPPAVGSATEIATFLASAAGSAAPVTTTDHALLFLTFALVVVGVAMLGADIVERGCGPFNLGLGLGLAWLFGPPLLAWLVSATGRPDFLDRYLMVSLPAAAVVLALVLDRLEPRALGVFALVYLTVFRFGVMVPTYRYSLDDYAGATRYVLAQDRTGDCITFASNEGRLLFDYYSAGHRGPVPLQVLPLAVNGSPAVILQYNSLPTSEITNLEQPQFVAQAALSCARIWLLESHQGSPTGSPASRELYRSFTALQRNLGAYYRVGSIHQQPRVLLVLYQRVRKP